MSADTADPRTTTPSRAVLVFAVRCPNPACRKYMLVEEADRGKVVECLICKQPIKVPGDLTITGPRTDPRP
jgi:hypothetical protein